MAGEIEGDESYFGGHRKDKRGHGVVDQAFGQHQPQAAGRTVLDASFAYEALTNRTNDHQEAVSAFLEKRAPEFTGE